MQQKQPGLEVRESFKVILQEASTRVECVCFAQWVVGGGGVNHMARVNAKVNRDGKTVSTSWRSAETKENFNYKFSKFSGIHYPAIATPLWGWGWFITLSNFTPSRRNGSTQGAFIWQASYYLLIEYRLTRGLWSCPTVGHTTIEASALHQV